MRTSSTSSLRRKVSNSKQGAGPVKKKLKNVDLGAWYDDNDDDIVESDSDQDFEGKEIEEESDEEETLDAKRIRLAKDYLKTLEADDEEATSDEEDEEDEDGRRDRISLRLQRERLKRQGTLERNLAQVVAHDIQALSPQTVSGDAYQEAQQWIESGRATYLRGHDLTVTCVSLEASGEKAVSGSKDNSVILWDVENQKKLLYLSRPWKKGSMEQPRGCREALAVACSDDGRYVAVGRRDATVSIYDIRLSCTQNSSNIVTTFEGHKGPVTCLAFRTQSNQLFSGSQDRCIRHYSLDEMTYVETLYGHQSAVSDMDCHSKERPISVGRDRTARAWKLAEDAHLIFRPGSHVPAADSVVVPREEWFVTGHENSQLSLWRTDKKRPVATIDWAHGQDGGIGRSITALGCLKGSDLVTSGSYDGYLRFWHVSMGLSVDERGIESAGAIPVYGYINGVAIGPKARFCVVAIGQEPSLGRWNRVAKAKNRLGIIRLRHNVADEEDDGPEDAQNIRKDAKGDKNEVNSDSESSVS